MANPQIENGHTQIANEILEQLIRLHLAPNQWQVLLCVIRKTYGYRKKVDYIANSQICEATGLGKSVVSRSLWLLEAMNLINRKGKNIGFQKDWERWRKLAKQSTILNNNKLAESSTLATKLAEQLTNEKLAISSTKLAESSTKVSSPVVTQKKKETIQKKDKESIKKVFGQFQNVLLTDDEHQKLVDKFGQVSTSEQIEALSEGIESKGYKYQSHYATILNWHRRDQGNNHKPAGRIPTKYTDPAELEDKA